MATTDTARPAFSDRIPLVRRVPVGLRYMASSALAFSLMSLFVKLAGQRLPSMQIVMVRCFLMGAFSLMMLWHAGLAPTGNDKRTLVLRGIFGFSALSLFYWAVTELPLGDVTAIQYTTPVWTAVIAAYFLKERPGRFVWIGSLVSLAGVVLVAKPSFLLDGLLGSGSADLNPLAVGAALVGSVLSASAYTFVRKLRATDDPLVVILWFSMVGVAGALPLTLLQWTTPTALEWGWLLMVGLTTQAGQVFLTKGLHLEMAGRAMSVGYLQVVFAFIWGGLFFATVPDVWSLIGAGVIVASVVGIIRR